MKLSIETEEEIRQVYQAYWDAYLRGDFITFASFLDDDIVIYGTAVGEIFTSKEEALKFYMATADEMTGKAEFRNRELSIQAIGDAVTIYELSQLYILIENTWTFYGYARITGILEKKSTGWKLVHQHGSFPDGRTEEGQQIAADKIKAENAQLREAVLRRTVELENKNHELEIEAALERVRAKAMSMRKPDDMLSVCETIAEQLDLLNVKHVRNVQTAIVSGASSGYYLNYQYFTPYQKGIIEHVAIEKHPRVKELIDRMQASPDAYFPASFTGKELDEWRQYRKEDNQFPDPILDDSDAVYFHFYSIGQGGIGISTYKELHPQDLQLFHRFRNVFALAYQRFRDIEQAGMLARESQIEAAMERVRARSISMHSSDELSDVIKLIYQELDKLKASNDSTDIEIGLIDEETGIAAVWAHLYQSDGTIATFNFPFSQIKETKNEWLQYKNTPPEQRNSLFITTVFEGDIIQNLFNSIVSFPELAEAFQPLIDAGIEKWVTHNAYFSHGMLTLQGTEPYPQETLEIQKRFARVFEQTYIRFLDLKKAEEQTYLARIEAALERVRARAMAMQEPEELIEVASVMRSEMGLLGIEDMETSSIYILNPDTHQADCWYAIKDIRQPDAPLLTDHIHIDLHQTWVGLEMMEFFRSELPMISIPMKGEQRKEWITYCSSVSKVLTGYYGDDIPERTYHLYKFSNGALGIAAQGDISETSWSLLQRCASVFSLAYARFKDLTQAREDLQRLKTEKQRAEDALTELKAAQSLLIQSEKMASLGELTAGIAHEIQNPLNFVNNFSEVSNELLDEMKEELATGNKQQAIEIADDVKQNLEKILTHGKRADTIVKGMLLHCRTSSAIKEPTDINALAEEYLRLAYHGLRAKDKTFNATIKTDFDTSIGHIEVVPQDIGRVLLNLITNAFHAVSAKSSALQTPYPLKGGAEYIPTVSVKTHKQLPLSGGRGLDKAMVNISITDNGTGIPDHIKDKIFQPFFTTKPTGQGTGLGLSLSYDIIKAHGGEMFVETVEGEGSTFILNLPV